VHWSSCKVTVILVRL